MAEVRLGRCAVMKLLLLPVLFTCIISCTNNILDIKREIQIPKEAREAKSADVAPVTPVKTPDFVPVHEDISPLKTRIVDISARNTPLRDVLFLISEATDLNLIMEKDIVPDLPITLTLKNVTAEDALNRACDSADYYYTVKDNMLYIKATTTRTYELGVPAIIQSYHIDLGGDMLGGATTGTTGSTTVKGIISQKAETDKSAYNFWEGIEKSLEKILGASTGSPSSSPYTLTINRMTGTIIVTATKKDLDKVENYLTTIKKVINRQVLVEAKIIEVILSDSLQFGIDWTLVSNTGDGRSATFATQKFSDVVPASGPSFSIATIASDFTSLLRAIQTQGETRILSNPRVNIMNGQTALLSVGQDQNYISKIETTTTAGTTPITTFSVNTSSLLSGIMIGIVPFISESGEISLNITPITSDLVRIDSQKLGTPDSSGNYPFLIQLPTINLRQMNTTVKVKNGHMVIIGGLIANREEYSDSQIPWLGDMPILGYLFKSRSKTVIKSELVILLQPVIISR